MKTISIINNWYNPNFKNELFLQSKDLNGNWDDIQTIDDPSKADYVVILDGGSNNLNKYSNINPDKILYFQTEPITYIKNYPAKYYGSLDNGQHYVGKWHVNIPYNELVDLKIPKKSKLISTITSNKATNINYQARIVTSVKLKNFLKNDFDWYGRGYNPITSLSGKWEGLIDYKYSFCSENNSIPHYFTEKITDCFLCWTKPIYWGCPNINKYFPEGSYFFIDIHEKNAIQMILEEIQKPIDYSLIEEARNLVLEKYGIYPSIKKVIEEL